MRILFFRHPGTNSRSHLLDMQRGFQRAGFDTIAIELGPMWTACEQAGRARNAVLSALTAHTAATLRANDVGLSIGMWANGLFSHGQTLVDGRPTSVFDEVGIPHLMWWLDAPHWAQQEQMHDHFRSPLMAAPMIHHMINNRATCREMIEVLGFRSTIALPYGIDESVFTPARGIEPEYDLVFGLGPGDPPPTPAMLAELENDEPDIDGLRRSIAERTRIQLRRRASQVPGNRDALIALLDALLDSQIADPRTPMPERLGPLVSADPSLRAGERMLRSDPALWVRLTGMIRDIERFRRPFVISYLARRFRCAVFGAGELEGWPCPVERLGHLRYEQMSEGYARGRVGLNVMRWQDDAGCNIKPLEISASGRPCLMADRADIDEVLQPGREIAVFGSPDEACDHLRELLDDPGRAQSMADAARERILEQHTWTVRAPQILRACLRGRADRLGHAAIEAKPLAPAITVR